MNPVLLVTKEHIKRAHNALADQSRGFVWHPNPEHFEAMRDSVAEALALIEAETRAALNAQAPPPPAEPPTPPYMSYAQRRANEIGEPIYVGPDPGGKAGQPHWVYPQRAAAPPPQPETLAADEIVERLGNLYDEMAAHALIKRRGSKVGEYAEKLNAILAELTAALAQPEKVTPTAKETP
jgi:hypothetical protein